MIPSKDRLKELAEYLHDMYFDEWWTGERLKECAQILEELAEAEEMWCVKNKRGRFVTAPGPGGRIDPIVDGQSGLVKVRLIAFPEAQDAD